MDDTRKCEFRALRTMRRCPRFDRCSAPKCPLDPLQDDRAYLPGEPKCTLSKSKRYAIGEDSDLPRQGLTKQEWAAMLRWHGLSETEKGRQQANLKGFWSIRPGILEPIAQERGLVAHRSKTTENRHKNPKLDIKRILTSPGKFLA